MTFRRISLAGLAVAALALAACSSDRKDSGDSTSTSAESTTSVAETTTTVAETTTTPAPTTAPPTTAPPTVPPTSPPAFTLYEVVGTPEVPSGHTDPFAASGVLADGVYWTTYDGGEEMTPSFTVYQAFFGDECISKAAELGDECNNDYLVPGSPSRSIDDLPFADDVVLTVSDVSTQQSHWITPAELVQIRAGSPSAGAPAGFSFTPFPFIMRVAGGEIVAFEQLWVP